jgi:ferrochelatase
MAKHVVVVTYGEPSKPGFGDQLAYSWQLRKGVARSTAHIKARLLPLIALSRALERNSMWRKHDYTSPLEANTMAQAAQLRTALARRSQEQWKIHVAYEFRKPYLISALKRLPRREMVIVVPMYAADSGFTHNLSRQSTEYLDKRRPAPIVVLKPLDVEQLASISANHVLHMLSAGTEPALRTALVLAARGSQMRPARGIETGRATLERLHQGIARRLAGSFGMVANGWMNYGRADRWTAPPIEDTLRRVSEAGFQDVVYYPYGFLADNAESQLHGQLVVEKDPHGFDFGFERPFEFAISRRAAADVADLRVDHLLALRDIGPPDHAVAPQ